MSKKVVKKLKVVTEALQEAVTPKMSELLHSTQGELNTVILKVNEIIRKLNK